MSRRTVFKWLKRFRQEGEGFLSSCRIVVRPRPGKTGRGRCWLGVPVGVYLNIWTMSRVISRYTSVT
ncbi:MAG: hypothetical protein H0S80_03085 [Desulfovibrionaceae bacterium]|nr:hypothetical protein [Desulfovibrionaceae bacterium]